MSSADNLPSDFRLGRPNELVGKQPSITQTYPHHGLLVFAVVQIEQTVVRFDPRIDQH